MSQQIEARNMAIDIGDRLNFVGDFPGASDEALRQGEIVPVTPGSTRTFLNVQGETGSERVQDADSKLSRIVNGK